MKSNMWKSTIREIRQSLGRYMAIIAIVALGVAFFAGLTMTQPQMLETTNEYYSEKQFFDYRILSTLGFEQEEVDWLASQEDVRSAEGIVSLDIICQDLDANEIVLKTYNVPNDINQVELVSGRMPENAEECVLDAFIFTEDYIGQMIRLSDSNDEDDLDCFKTREFTVVGLIKSPNYIQYERGTTSLGNGTIAGFMYVPMESYDVDFFTEILIRFDQDYDIYSDEYEAFMDDKEPVWEALAEEAAFQRYDRLMADAQEELADAKQELADGKAEGEEELEDARIELADAEAELKDGEEKIADAKQELADGRKELADAEAELADGIQELAEKEQELVDAQQEIADAWEEWQVNSDELDAAMDSVEAGQAELDETKAQLTLLENTPMEQLQMALQYAQAMGDSEAMAQYQQSIEMKQNLPILCAQIEAAQLQLDEGRDQIEGGNEQLAAAYMELKEAEREIADGWEQIADAKLDIEEAKQEIADAKVELADGEKELAEKEQELLDGWDEYNDGVKEYEEGYQEFLDEIADAEDKIADAEADINDIEEPDSYLLGRETNVGYVCFENDSSIVAGISKVFPVFFFAVAALVCMTTMNRMVEEQRTQIGVLKALGYSQASIMWKYIFYSGSAALIGCLIGFFGGTWLFPEVIWYAYGMMYDVASLVYVFDWRLLVISLVVSLLCSAGTTWLTCRYELAEVAAELMRPKAPKAGKRVLLERIPFIWKRLKFLYKVSYRNIFRYKKRFLMMVMGISGCTALVVTGLGVRDSITNLPSDQYERIQVYDMEITLSDALTPEVEKQIVETGDDRIQAYMTVAESNIDIVTDDAFKSVNLVVVEDGQALSSFVNLYSAEDEIIPFPQTGQCIVSHKVAGELGLTVGGKVVLQDEDMRSMEVELSHDFKNYLYNYVYMTEDTYEQYMGETPTYKTIYLNVAEGCDEHALMTEIMQLDDVAAVTVVSDDQARFESMLGSMNLIVGVIILCAAGLAFIVLYNLTNINITERIREIATIKVLGFYKSETASYVFRENLVLTFIGALVGLVLGKWLHSFVMGQIVVDQIAFEVRITPLSYVLGAVLTFAFACMVNATMSGKLERVSMTESLKSVD